MVRYDEGEKNNNQYIIVKMDESVFGLSRDELVHVLHAENVRARRYFYPGCHRMEPYRSYFPHAGLLLPETERLCQRVMSLPTGTAVGDPEIVKIAGIIRTALANAAAVKENITSVK